MRKLKIPVIIKVDKVSNGVDIPLDAIALEKIINEIPVEVLERFAKVYIEEDTLIVNIPVPNPDDNYRMDCKKKYHELYYSNEDGRWVEEIHVDISAIY